eukprot:UN15099
MASPSRISQVILLSSKVLSETILKRYAISLMQNESFSSCITHLKSKIYSDLAFRTT